MADSSAKPLPALFTALTGPDGSFSLMATIGLALFIIAVTLLFAYLRKKAGV